MKKYLVRGDNLDELIENAASSLKTDRKFIKYEVIKHIKNIFGKTKEIELKLWVEIPVCNIENKDSEECKILEEVRNKENNKEDEETEEYFLVKILKSGIYLMLKPNIDVEKVGKSFLVEKALGMQFKNPNSEEIKKVVYEKSGDYIKIGDYDVNYYIDAKPKLSVNKKGMEVTIEVVPPEKGNHISKEMILIEMQKIGIKYGIKEEELDRIEKHRIYEEVIVIAEGKYPIDGEDAKIIHLFETSEKLEFKMDETGRVDFKEITNSILNINKGEVISKKIPPTKGIDGINVYGEIVEPKPGKDKFFFKGKNVEERDGGNELLAMIEGRVSVVNQMINVFPLLQIEGDIDLSIGNVDFIGTVFIKGRIMEGFTVKAGGDIIVDGVIENANVEAKGNILVKNGIIGKENSEIAVKAGGDVRTNFIQNMVVRAEGDVVVKEHVLNSAIESGESIKVFEGKGKIIGGRIVAVKEIIAREVGNEFENITILEVGISPENRARKSEIENTLSMKEREREKNDVEIKTLTHQKENASLDEKKQKIYLEKVKKQFVLAKELKELRDERDKLEHHFENAKKGKIHVRDVMHAGVVFRIGDSQLNVKENFKFVTFYLDEKKCEIALLPFEKDDLERR